MTKFIILLDGAKGAGKSTICALLRDDLPRTAFISLDTIRKFISDSKPINEDNAIAMAGILQLAESFITSGINIVLDGGLNESRIEAFDLMAKKHNSKILKYQLTAPKETLLDRVRQRDKEKGKATDEERFYYTYQRQQSKDFTQFKNFDTTMIDADSIVKVILQDLGLKYKI